MAGNGTSGVSPDSLAGWQPEYNYDFSRTISNVALRLIFPVPKNETTNFAMKMKTMTKMVKALAQVREIRLERNAIDAFPPERDVIDASQRAQNVIDAIP